MSEETARRIGRLQQALRTVLDGPCPGAEWDGGKAAVPDAFVLEGNGTVVRFVLSQPSSTKPWEPLDPAKFLVDAREWLCAGAVREEVPVNDRARGHHVAAWRWTLRYDLRELARTRTPRQQSVLWFVISVALLLALAAVQYSIIN